MKGEGISGKTEPKAEISVALALAVILPESVILPVNHRHKASSRRVTRLTDNDSLHSESAERVLYLLVFRHQESYARHL